MYCKKCGAANIEEARFCRLCGIQLQEAPIQPALQSAAAARDLAYAIRKLVTGVGFLLAAIVLISVSHGMWWWFLFPCIPMISKGLRGLRRYRRACARSQLSSSYPADNRTRAMQPSTNEVWVRPTGELVAPSVTEHTTKLFEETSGPANNPEPQHASPGSHFTQMQPSAH